MDWQGSTLTYRAVTPLLLGEHPLGFIQRTRHYIPGWALWGALTATLTHACFGEADGARYAAVGEWVKAHLRTSYGYLLVDGQVAAPHFQDGRWCYGPLRAATFEARFIASIGQTAVAPGSVTAETGALHETEVLSARDPVTKEAVHWRFTLYRRRDAPAATPAAAGVAATLSALSDETLLAALQTLQVGADRGYGLGRLELKTQGEWSDAGDAAGPAPRAEPVQDDKGEITTTLKAHVAVATLAGSRVRGRAQAIPWRWWKNTPDPDGRSWGPGQQRSVQVFYVPGSIVAGDWSPVIGPYGIWE